MHSLFKAIVTHFRVDSDELTAIYLTIRFGFWQFFGNAEAVLVEFTDAGTRTPDGKTATTWMTQGFLPFGIGGPQGPFDEHQDGSEPRKEGKCAATLVAEYLGISEDPKLKPILKYILACDYGNQAFCSDGLSVLVKVLHWQYPNAPHVAMDWFFQALDAKYGDDTEPCNFTLEYLYERLLSLGYEGADDWYKLAKDAMEAQEVHFHTITAVEFSENAEIFSVAGSTGKDIKIAVVTSDDELICRYAFSKSGQCGVLVQKKSTGNIQIFSSKHQGVYLNEVARVIRKLEMNALGISVQNPHGLTWEGNSPYETRWCFMHRIFMFNGSLTAPNVEPTQLSLKQVVDAVCRGLAVRRAKKYAKKTEKMAA